MVRLDYFFWAVFTLSALLANANHTPLSIDNDMSIHENINSYLSTINYELEDETVGVFSDFLVVENEDLYNVDFMLSDDGEVMILSKEYEVEFYKVDHYSTQFLKTQTIKIAKVES